MLEKLMNVHIKFGIRLFILMFFGFYFVNSQQMNERDSLFYLARELTFMQPDKAIDSYNKSIELSLEKNDTIRAVEGLIEVGDIYSHHVNYSKAYDSFWRGLLLEDGKVTTRVGRIYKGLGWLYSFFERDDEALKYLNMSLDLNKEMFRSNIILTEVYMLSDYFALTSFHRVRGEYETAQKYLDSSITAKNNILLNSKNFYLEAESGYLKCMRGDKAKGLDELESAEDYFKENDPSYLVLIYYMYGDAYRKSGNREKAEMYYLKSLEVSKKYRSHSNYKIKDFKALKELQLLKKDYEKAFYYLEKEKELNDEVFGIKNKNNLPLFDIKDKFRLTKERLEDQENEQRLKVLEHEEDIWHLKTIFLIFSIVGILVFTFFFIRNLRQKHRAEKQVIRERQDAETKRQEEILEMKNKELTSSALRLIEKEEFLNSLNSKLSQQKDTVDVKTISRMVKTIQGSSSSNWKEFEARFTSINQSFYENLKEKHPKLKSADLKICALIRLNFSSKEMAPLLGISVESIHTSRYRLRKKLGLERTENLSEYINSF
ncbi:hypothetical protein [Flavicella sp.]|uniref:tetratricopeptide repeat protein n=1 Tax=Flavicella sp. TaxID=2957742 RepID=UPI002603D924|nr:hypothetical protein [Flavicella sp.]MDG1803807.1 hypothetical protein [Flavicella sp.]